MAASVSLTGCDSNVDDPTGGEGSSTSGGPQDTTTTDPLPPATMSTSATSGQPATTATTTPPTTSGPGTTTADPTAATDDSESDSDDVTGQPAEGWFEVGYGLDEFFPFEESLPIYTGPQGFYMFSLPLRGSDFPVAPDPLDFNHPDAPVLSIWADVDGIEGPHPSGHFSVYMDYPVGFSVALDSEADYEFVAVWLVTPDAYPPQDLVGRTATIHAELQCADGQLLVDEHQLVIIDGAI